MAYADADRAAGVTMTAGDDPPAEADSDGSGIARRLGSELTSSPPGMSTPGKRNSGGSRRKAESNKSDPNWDDYERHYRFSIGLKIKHPALSRAEIEQALGITPMYGWDVGKPRVTAIGKPLPGLSPFTYFGFSEKVRYKRSFFGSALGMLERLEAASEFVRSITDTGGEVSIDVALYGRRNIGDVIGWPALMRFAALKVELGVEVFPVKQRGW